jgi:hypothetical protein
MEHEIRNPTNFTSPFLDLSAVFWRFIEVCIAYINIKAF